MINCIEDSKEILYSDSFTILNYPGSKKKLINFIHCNLAPFIDPQKAILDIFAGTCSVGYSYKKTHQVYANDCEYYSSLISKALLGNYEKYSLKDIIQELKIRYGENHKKLHGKLAFFIKQENNYVINSNFNDLENLYLDFPTIWNNKIILNSSNNYDLFSSYYAGNYFGINQAIEIDSLRYAIESFYNSDIFAVLMASLFYAMKECVFSKDGHMAQPLDINKNKLKLKQQREKSIYDSFISKLSEFFSPNFVVSKQNNKVFNLDFKDLLKNEDIKNNVGFIYADPPYTDMQYSRYYHLLNVVAKYNYPKPTLLNNNFTSGLYTEDRFQSDLSRKGSCFNAFENLITYSKAYNKNLAISFAYPKDTENQKTDRYVMSIEQIENACINQFGKQNVKIVAIDYMHSNNRNAFTKKVLEYLVICKH